jgi:hypothetical protein
VEGTSNHEKPAIIVAAISDFICIEPCRAGFNRQPAALEFFIQVISLKLRKWRYLDLVEVSPVIAENWGFSDGRCTKG